MNKGQNTTRNNQVTACDTYTSISKEVYKDSVKKRLSNVKGFSEIIYVNPNMISPETVAYYEPEKNIIVICVSPDRLENEYEFYGLSGVTRDLTAVVIHELTHWATRNLNGHEIEKTMTNPYRTRNLLHCSLWNLTIHSILYDLRRSNPNKTYL